MLEVGPVPDWMHGLVVGHLLQHGAGGGPGYTLQLQKAHGEPQREQLAKLRIHRLHVGQGSLKREE